MDHETVTTTTTEAAADDAAPDIAQTLRVAITAAQVKALLRCAGTDALRGYLNAICIDTTGPEPVAVATNGTVLLAVRLPARNDDMANPRGQWIIARDHFKAVKAEKSGRGLPFALVVTCEHFGAREPTMQGGAGFSIKGATTATGTTLDLGRFPDWRRVVPLNVSGVKAQYNCELAGIFGDVASDLNIKYAPIGHNGEAAGLVDLGADAVGVIMPMRTDKVPAPTARPDWIG